MEKFRAKATNCKERNDRRKRARKEKRNLVLIIKVKGNMRLPNSTMQLTKNSSERDEKDLCVSYWFKLPRRKLHKSLTRHTRNQYEKTEFDDYW